MAEVKGELELSDSKNLPFHSPQGKQMGFLSDTVLDQLDGGCLECLLRIGRLH